MNCPRCSRPMVEGYVPAFKTKLLWIPKEVKPPIFITSVPRGAIELTSTPIFSTIRKIAYHCNECSMIVMSSVNQNN